MNCPNCDAPYETTGDEDGFAACFSCNHEFEFNMIPTLFSLTPTDKIRLVAELDGWTFHPSKDNTQGIARLEYWLDPDGEPYYCDAKDLPIKYSTSYDAIIPLIQKQDIEIRRDVYRALHRDKYERDTDTTVRFSVDIGNFINFTPSQLLDALLVATGKATI